DSTDWTYFKGRIDEFRLWNRVLNADEIRAVYRISASSDGR
ncbi:MAG: hypothetical protein KDM91_02330, partial [Verrucomicrobiae bacterium]|nr:hypothetical protein [Verrucomicrobiae bacterium]